MFECRETKGQGDFIQLSFIIWRRRSALGLSLSASNFNPPPPATKTPHHHHPCTHEWWCASNQETWFVTRLETLRLRDHIFYVCFIFCQYEMLTRIAHRLARTKVAYMHNVTLFVNKSQVTRCARFYYVSITQNGKIMTFYLETLTILI